ncbi:CBS domain-containing protein [Amycolatopsis benzoatilytica]|uniref:CBS domain-containing protein n=1 Tax=Amycolatopsis benzoatilytica TaxID=346045 RepID=UPI0003826053|nr:CBS domain-containing protein [Amycolatopsis benzoatilytica]
MQAREIMTTPVIAVTPSATLGEASRLMTQHGFTTLPVVDEGGRLLGVVSEEDLVREGFPDPERPDEADPDGGVLLSGHRTAGTVMRTPGMAAAADLEVTELAHRMAAARLRSIPVVDSGVLVGIVTFQDVLRVVPAAGRP